MQVAVRAAAALLLVSLSVGRLPAAQKKTVTFMCAEAELPRESVQRFSAANPDINLVRVDENWTTWTTEAATGGAADLARMGVGTDTGYYAKRGFLYDMTAMIRSSAVVRPSDIDRPASAAYRFDGRDYGKGAWYGLAEAASNIGCITYNREMFEAAGIPFPSETRPMSYDELFSLAKRLTRRDSSGTVTVWGYDVDSAWVPFLVSDMATARGIGFYAGPEKDVLNADPRLKDLWKYWARFPAQDVSSNSRNPNPGWQGSAFQSDRAAIAQLGYWYGAQLASDRGDLQKYGWAPTPVVRAGARRVTSTMGATGVVMEARTRVPREAFRVWEWYVGGERGAERARAGWGIPPLLSMRGLMPGATSFDRSRRAVALDDAKYFTVWQASPCITWTPFAAAYARHIDSLVRGIVSEDEFANLVCADINADLAAGRAELGE